MKIFNLYKNIIIPKLMENLKYKNIMQVPRILKIVINVGINYVFLNKKKINDILLNLKLISGQKPIITCARKSIANFKIRQGFPVGCKVTLRKNNMWFFLEKLIYIVIPRIRDFQGFSKNSFDKNGNFNIGIKEHTIFPEINYERTSIVHGLNISIITSTNSIKESLMLFNLLLFPIKKTV